MHPTKFTQTEAARAVGLTRTSIWRAIRKGKLSAERAEDGSVCIDASELVRVFPEANLESARVRAPEGTANAPERADANAELSSLRVLVDELKADKIHLRAELERAAVERARLADERAELLAMLKAQSEQVRLLTDARERPKRRWWSPWRRRAQ